MRLTATLAVLAGLQLAAAVKPPGFPHRPPQPHHRSALPPGPPYSHPRYPPPGPHRGFSPRPYGPAAQIRPYGHPYPPPPPPHRVAPRPAAAATTAAPPAQTEPETVAPPLTTVAAITTASPQPATESNTESTVYFSTAAHVAGTSSGDSGPAAAVAEAPPTAESKPAAAQAKQSPKPSPSPIHRSPPKPAIYRRPPQPVARPPHHSPPHPAHPRPAPYGYRSPPTPVPHHQPAQHPPRGHSKPKTYYISGTRPSPSTTPVPPAPTAAPKPVLAVTEPVPVPSQAPEEQPAASPEPTYTTYTSEAASTPTAVSTEGYLPSPAPREAPEPAAPESAAPETSAPETAAPEPVPTAAVYAQRQPESAAERVVPSYPSPPPQVPSQPPRYEPVHYQLSYGAGDDYDGDDSSNIPGVANVDYPTLSEIPETSFTCDGKIPGYYADQEASCQVWHYCGQSVNFQSFLCPVGTVYSQTTRVCDWWFNVNCAASESQYGVNADLYQPAAAGYGYGQRNSAGPGVEGKLAPQPYSRGPHEYHALPPPAESK